MKTLLIAGALALASTALGACAGLPFTGNPAADAKTAAANLSTINGGLAAFNQAAMQQILLACGTDVDVSVGFPAPVPTGKLDFKCHIAPGQLKMENGQIVTVTPPATFGNMPAALVGSGPSVTPTPAAPQ